MRPLKNTLFYLKKYCNGGSVMITPEPPCSFKQIETFEKCSILFKVKEGENFNHRHTLSIPRIEI